MESAPDKREDPVQAAVSTQQSSAPPPAETPPHQPGVQSTISSHQDDEDEDEDSDLDDLDGTILFSI